MKQQFLIEASIPDNAETLPEIKTDGSYELLWSLKNGSYVRLIFESGAPVHEIYGKLVASETAKRQAEEKDGVPST